MNNEFKFSKVNDPKHFRPETSFVCEVCCDQGVLESHNGCLIFHCPDHMTLCIKDGEVLSARTNGIRQ